MNLYEAAERLGWLGSVGSRMSEHEFRSFRRFEERIREKLSVKRDGLVFGQPTILTNHGIEYIPKYYK